MTIHEQKLRAMAKQMPMFATELVAAADNIKDLKGAIWRNRPDINKLKARGIYDLIESSSNATLIDGVITRVITVIDAKDYANKLEKRRMSENIERLQARIELHETEREKARELGDYKSFEREENEIKNVTAMIEGVEKWGGLT